MNAGRQCLHTYVSLSVGLLELMIIRIIELQCNSLNELNFLTASIHLLNYLTTGATTRACTQSAIKYIGIGCCCCRQSIDSLSAA